LLERVAQIVLCYSELDSGSHNLLILFDAETSSDDIIALVAIWAIAPLDLIIQN